MTAPESTASRRRSSSESSEPSDGCGADEKHDDVDVAVVTGRLSSDPVLTDLASGSVLHRYEVTARHGSGTVTVPVVWFDPSRPPALREGDGVVVVGHVRRRFFRAGGATRSSTEVVAASVSRSGRNQRALRALEEAVSALSTRRD